jgi:putative sterol carrier protein
MGKHPFLSAAWIEAARAIYTEHRSDAPPVAVPIKANLVITDVPFDDKAILAHLDTSAGELELELGHAEGADVALTLEYATAKALIVDHDQAAVVQAFMSGRIKIEGDMMKLLALASGVGSEDAEALGRRVAADLDAITE